MTSVQYLFILLLFVLLMVGGLQVFNSKYKSEICY